MKTTLTSSLLLFLLFIACEESSTEKEQTITTSISGYVQKGPFLNGTSITVSELDETLIATGRAFSSQLLDNSGTFNIEGVELESQYVEVKASGFYFNEFSNSNSDAQLTLYALSDITDRTSLNINLLSNLERRRVLFLIGTGLSFSDAKQQAQSEILNIFSMSLSSSSDSEDLDISKAGESNAALLAISVILQGPLSVGDMSELVANISSDIFDDGILDDISLGTQLANNASLINTTEVRSNLEARYQDLGIEATIPDFETHLTQFLENTDFASDNLIEYPATGNYGPNILEQGKTSYGDGDHSVTAILANGTSLKIKLYGINWLFAPLQTETGWTVSPWNDAESSRTFTSNKTGTLDIQIQLANVLGDSTTVIEEGMLIEGYENGATEPSWSKDISIGG